MKGKWKVITGNAKEIETELNEINDNWFISIAGMSSSNDKTTVILEIVGSK